MQPSTTFSTNTEFHSWPLAEWMVERQVVLIAQRHPTANDRCSCVSCHEFSLGGGPDTRQCGSGRGLPSAEPKALALVLRGRDNQGMRFDLTDLRLFLHVVEAENDASGRAGRHVTRLRK